MNRKEVFEAMSHNETWEKATEKAQDTFCAEMEACTYGQSQTWNAFTWFLVGRKSMIPKRGK